MRQENQTIFYFNYKLNVMMENEMIKIRELFDFMKEQLNGQDNVVKGKLHIISMSNLGDPDTEIRIYHSDGYCINLVSEYFVKPDESDRCPLDDYPLDDGYVYHYNDQWDGFKEIDPDDFMKKVKSDIKTYDKVMAYTIADVITKNSTYGLNLTGKKK